MRNHWINSAKFDITWLIAPMLLPPILVFFLPADFLNQQRDDIFPWSWILIVLTIDVAHVYSTVYKTYFHPEGKRKHKLKLLFFPVLVWIIGALVYSIGSKLFWSCVAYFAVYHFIRQQYGFFRLYSLKREDHPLIRKAMNWCLYATMIIPLVIWHARGQQHFNWMTEGDFLYLNLPVIVPFLQVLLMCTLVLYFFLEWKSMKRHGSWMLGRSLLLFSTAFSYYIGIVWNNNDFVFSFVNVIGHGIPYLALVWWSEKRQLNESSSSFLKLVLSKWGWILFYLIVFAFAFVEEALWDSLLYREHATAFGWLYGFISVLRHPVFITIVVPLLIMPQIVHYILDAYIWKKADNRKFVEGEINFTSKQET